jgi:phosphatidate phosphatase LPIN
MQTILSVFRPFESLFAFNQATFSGCMDVIVVEQSDKKYKCTPFHARFGHFKLIKVKDVSVILEVNDNNVGIEMKIAEDGHAYFLKEIIRDGKRMIK